MQHFHDQRLPSRAVVFMPNPRHAFGSLPDLRCAVASQLRTKLEPHIWRNCWFGTAYVGAVQTEPKSENKNVIGTIKIEKYFLQFSHFASIFPSFPKYPSSRSNACSSTAVLTSVTSVGFLFLRADLAAAAGPPAFLLLLGSPLPPSLSPPPPSAHPRSYAPSPGFCSAPAYFAVRRGVFGRPACVLMR